MTSELIPCGGGGGGGCGLWPGPTVHTPGLLTHTLRHVSSVPALYWFISEVNTGNIFDTYQHTLNSVSQALIMLVMMMVQFLSIASVPLPVTE